MATDPDVDTLRTNGDIIWENRRYRALYVVDRQHLLTMVKESIPVLHLGQDMAVQATIQAVRTRWTVVELWCPRDIAESRIVARSTGDVEERLTAWDQTERLAAADLRIDTSQVEPELAARLIDEHVRQR
ncbi:hypothetical protein [Actinokineospora sp.]|uniref:hypothetical protein n=1 Tax=Actinokineospora sp. TaxID=1872133 RepID=UPI003D6B8326